MSLLQPTAVFQQAAVLRQTTVRNGLLRSLSAGDFDALRPHLQSVATPLRMSMIEANRPIEYLYFQELGFASVTAESSLGKIELGMIGREGLVGAAPVMLGLDRSPHDTFIQMAGEALRISTRDLLAAAASSPTLPTLLLRYVHILMVQTAQTAFSNAAYTIEVRLARWLLMCRDRCEGDDMFVTHEFLSMMLGVRRPGVTVAIQILEGKHLIKATRGTIRILDRRGLEGAADDSYGLPEAEYARLIGIA